MNNYDLLWTKCTLNSLQDSKLLEGRGILILLEQMNLFLITV